MMRRIGHGSVVGQTKSKKSFFKSKGPRRWSINWRNLPRQKSCVLYMLICVVTLLLFFSIEGTTITKISKKHVEFINLNKLYSKHASTVGTLNDRVAVLQVEVDEETKAGANNNSLKHVLEDIQSWERQQQQQNSHNTHDQQQQQQQQHQHQQLVEICKELQFEQKEGYELNMYSGATLYTFDGLKIDTSKIKVSRGGEEVSSVLNRREGDEIPTYQSGAVTLRTTPKLATKNKWYQRTFLQSAVVGDVTCATQWKGTTVMVQRYEYANLWHTMTDWFNLFWTLEHLSETVDHIVFLDGHAKGALDEVWATVFAHDVHYVKHLPREVCFERVVLLPKATPLWNTIAPRNCTDFMDRFVARVLGQYEVHRPARPADDLAIERGFYMAHPRVKHKASRAKPVPGRKQLKLHELSFKHQLEALVNAERFSGMHGAGLTHLIWMAPNTTVVEWMPTSHQSVELYRRIVTWRPNVAYKRRPANKL